MTPLRIVVDDSAMVKAAARRATWGALKPAGLVWLLLGGANVVLGVLDVLQHRPSHDGWFYVFIGLLYMVIARVGNGWRVTVPTEFVVSDDGVAVAVRGEASARTYPWKRVRTAINNKAFFIVNVAPTRVAAFQRTIYVPKPDDAALCDAIWTSLSAHMIAPRGLRATPADRLGVIQNTAFG